MKKLRLIVTESCNRHCAGYCNKDWDIKSLPEISDYENFFFGDYNEILITGGEPVLEFELVLSLIKSIKERFPHVKVYVYTAWTGDLSPLFKVFCESDGICFTLHEQKDVLKFLFFAMLVHHAQLKKSLKLNIFKGIKIDKEDLLLSGWSIKDGIKWIKNCPLPEDEVFMKLKA